MTGITVTLYERTESGRDSLNNPVWTLTAATVNNVLVGQPTTEELRNTLTLDGRRLDYVLGIPKGDAHNWKGCEVEFFGSRFRQFGDVIEGIEANIPTAWHKKVKVERIE